jgi:hypothetical protein
MSSSRVRIIRAGVIATIALSLALTGCFQNEPKATADNQAGDQAKQVSSHMDKPYLLNENGELIQSIPPEILSAIKKDLLSKSQVAAAANLDSLYDPVSGNLLEAAKANEIQFQADTIAQALAKGASL